MKTRIYIETSIISYLTMRPSRDVVVAGHQAVTVEWWETSRDRFELVASQLVAQEAGTGDPEAAQRRLRALEVVSLLEITDEASALARQLISAGAVPETSLEDALHIAIAVTNGVDYLLTWNCRHLANAAMRTRIDGVCLDAGYGPVVICTPEELLEG